MEKRQQLFSLIFLNPSLTLRRKKNKKNHQNHPTPPAPQQKLRAQHRIKALLNANRKKSVHISLFTKTHSAFKQATVSRDLSMQETFEYLASLIVDEHPSILKLLDEYIAQKRENKIANLEAKYAESLYDVIGHDNPFKEKNEEDMD